MTLDLQSSDSIAIECPGCSRGNSCTVGNVETCICSRCGCDLASLAEVAFESHSLSALAGSALRSGEYEDAMDLALKSWELKHHAAAARVGLLASLALGESAAASRWAASKAALGSDGLGR
jgi:hypothetical protein